MRKTLMLFTFAAAAVTLAHAGECHFDRSLNVSGAGSLDASTGSGNIELRPGSDSQIHIYGHAKSSGWMHAGDADVQRVCNEPPIEQNGNDVRIGRRQDDWMRNIGIDYVIEVPRSFTVVAGSGSGNVRAKDLAAVSKLGTGSGNVDAENIGGSPKLETGSGDIRASFSGSGDVRAETGTGSIRLENVHGGLHADTGTGDVTASGKAVSSWRVSTGSGSVNLHLGNSGYNLDAQTGSGSINTKQPVNSQSSSDKTHVRGTVNGGGPDVRVDTGSGSIEID